MSKLHAAPGILFVAGLLALGCVVSPEDAAVDGDLSVPLETTEGPMGMNGLLPVDVWHFPNRVALWELGQGALLDANNELVSTDLTSTPGGSSVLEYVIRCALPEGVAVMVGKKALFGAFGLAPEWPERALDSGEQRWVTACLAQHINATGVHVPIMMTGGHAALVAQPWATPELFTVDESTMFGNLFAGTLPPNPIDPPGIFACTERHLDAACGADAEYWLVQRVCAGSAVCGLTPLGSCDEHPGCTMTEKGHWSCSGFTQTIRVSLKPGDAQAEYELCQF